MITFPTYDAVDLFAGPGGWSLACKRLGIREIGIETDRAAHLTRRAAGFHTIRASVTDCGPANFPNARGLIASPPCPTFSAAGKGSGRRELDAVMRGLQAIASGSKPDHQWEDARTGLTLEPMRWVAEAAQQGRAYEWIALEQVPTVLPVWEAMAEHLREYGYSVVTGNLQAEQYGVAQTRKRAILIARLLPNGTHYPWPVGTLVDLPKPTHSRYYPRDKTRVDPGVLPWVTMADALGWDAEPFGNAAPSFTLTGADGGGSKRLQWFNERPATTIVGTFQPDVVAAPAARRAGGYSRQNQPGSVRVSVQEAAVLQSFPPDFPWQGTKTQQYQQVGNAVPPLLAEAVLRQVL